jgi:hypothetical protein
VSAKRKPSTIDSTAQRIANDDDAEPFTPPAWHTDPKASIPLGYQLDESTEPATHRLTIGAPSPSTPVVKSALSPVELPTEQLIGLAAAAYEHATHAKCSRIMAQTIAQGWRACYARAMH